MGDILIVDANTQRAMCVAEVLGALGTKWRVADSLAECLAQVASCVPDMVLTTEKLPDGHCSNLLRALAEICDVVVVGDLITPDVMLECISLGARDFLVHPVSKSMLEPLVGHLRTRSGISSRCEPLEADTQSESGMVVGMCQGMLEALKTAGLAARTSASVMIYGESGTGKDLMAREIHNASERTGAFVALNCAAVAEGLCESELFGHERGAFTGAVTRRAGCFEQADGGTLFLDEIGEASPAFQAKLLRALDRGEFTRVGGQSLVHTDARLVAATNRDLLAMVDAGEFRLDLFYRLSAVTISLPPLRERREDIPHIVSAMLAQVLKEETKSEIRGVSESAVEYLVGYDWPGNLRELQHAVHRAVLACKQGVICPEHFGGLKSPGSSKYSQLESLREIEQAHIERVLLATGGNQGRACELLGVSRPTLRRKIRKYALVATAGTEFDLDLEDCSTDNYEQ